MRPTRDEMLMDMAQVVAARSTCDRLRVGAIIARDGRSLSMGYNGAPAGMPHCDHSRCTCGQWPAAAMTADFMESGTHLPNCPQGPCVQSVHAEANAIVWAARWGVTTDGTELFTTHAPCRDCAKLIVNAGIMRVVYSVPYRLTDGLELLASVNVEVVKL